MVFSAWARRTALLQELRGCIEGITHIKWITDKQTREFYGSTFLELKDAKAASLAVQKDKSKFMGRPLKIYYCPPRPGDIWPPRFDGSDGPGGGGYSGGSSSSSSANGDGGRNLNAKPRSEKSAKPEGCKKLFAGNLAYTIDDDTMVDFFKDCGTLAGLRWLTHKGTEEFRGCGFVEFGSSEEADKAMELDGAMLLGRPIRLDWTD